MVTKTWKIINFEKKKCDLFIFGPKLEFSKFHTCMALPCSEGSQFETNAFVRQFCLFWHKSRNLLDMVTNQREFEK